MITLKSGDFCYLKDSFIKVVVIKFIIDKPNHQLSKVIVEKSDNQRLIVAYKDLVTLKDYRIHRIDGILL
jgi:hypothetical protein